jgi:hypothetical protein
MRRITINRLAMVGIFAALVYALYAFPVAERVVVLVDWAQANSLAGAAVYIVCVVLATVLFVPGSGSMMIAGYVFGLAMGTLVSAIAITLGAQCAFLTGRLVARSWVHSIQPSQLCVRHYLRSRRRAFHGDGSRNVHPCGSLRLSGNPGARHWTNIVRYDSVVDSGLRDCGIRYRCYCDIDLGNASCREPCSRAPPASTGNGQCLIIFAQP